MSKTHVPSSTRHTTTVMALGWLVIANALLMLGGCSSDNKDSKHDAGGAGMSAAGSSGAGGAGASGAAGTLGVSGSGGGAGSAGTAAADASDDMDAGNLPDSGQTAGAPHWITTWSTALIDGGPGAALARTFNNQTLRQIVHTSAAGTRVRVRVSNVFGSDPLHITTAHIALRDTGASIKASSDRKLTFGGADEVTVAIGKSVTSDDVELAIPALSDVAVSIDLPDATVGRTMHNDALQTSYIVKAGAAGSTTLDNPMTITQWFFLDGVEVLGTAASQTVAAIGDSITDGFSSAVDTNARWPDELAKRAAAGKLAIGVANEGYDANQILVDGAGGPATLERFERDVLGNSGVTHVILIEGINDIGLSAATFEALQTGIEQLIDKAHAGKIKIVGGTVLPFEGALYYSAAGEQARSKLNDWIRTSDKLDGFVDFDAALRDPNAKTKLLAKYDSGDHLHPSADGYAAMGDAVDLKLLQ